eukprot:gene13242-19078_t
MKAIPAASEDSLGWRKGNEKGLSEVEGKKNEKPSNCPIASTFAATYQSNSISLSLPPCSMIGRNKRGGLPLKWTAMTSLLFLKGHSAPLVPKPHRLHYPPAPQLPCHPPLQVRLFLRLSSTAPTATFAPSCFSKGPIAITSATIGPIAITLRYHRHTSITHHLTYFKNTPPGGGGVMPASGWGSSAGLYIALGMLILVVLLATVAFFKWNAWFGSSMTVYHPAPERDPVDGVLLANILRSDQAVSAALYAPLT